MALRSLTVKHPAGASLLSLLSSGSRRPFSAAPLFPSGFPRLPRLRPLVALAVPRRVAPLAKRSLDGLRCFSVSRTASSLNDPSPNWSNRPPKETILLDGCDFEHWLVVVEPPDPSLTRDEIIKSYIKTLAQVIGSEEEARFKIYSVSTKHYFAFGALVSEELSYKLKELPGVRWVLPDSYLDVKNKDYGGEPFINGEAVPYDPKYHEEWVRNNARAMERNRRNDRPRNFDRSRNFERRRENMQNFQNRGVPPPPPSSPMQTQELGNLSNQGPMTPGNMPGQGPLPPPMAGHNPQNAVPPPMPGQNPQNAMPPPVPGHNPQNAIPSANMPNLGGPNYRGYQNQIPGQNPVPPPLHGQNPQPGMPPRNAPNFGAPNRDFGGFQNQVPNYQNSPPQANQSYNGGGNPYQNANPYPVGGNAYQGGPNDYQGGRPMYQGPPSSYQGNPGNYQAPPNSYQGNAYQGGDGGSDGSYQGQDAPGRKY